MDIIHSNLIILADIRSQYHLVQLIEPDITSIADFQQLPCVQR